MTKLLLLLTSFLGSCQSPQQFPNTINNSPNISTRYRSISEIPVPNDYERLPDSSNGFGTWLRSIPLRSDNKVYLYNGRLKENQSAQFAVLDISVGKKDLQQCADAVMRLRAEYLLTVQPASISFISTSGQELSFAQWRSGIRYKLAGNRLQAYQSHAPSRSTINDLPAFMELVFSYCGTASLQRQLKSVKSYRDIHPGDVFVKPGFPGHAVIVVDVAVNKKGRKQFLLAQSYMPAQDIHILRNPQNPVDDPWYDLEEMNELVTPEWVFQKDELYRW